MSRRHRLRGMRSPYTSSLVVSRSYPHTVKVNHIPSSVGKQQLSSLFDQHGSCEVHLRRQYGHEDQHAFVNFTSKAAAQTAARGLNGTLLGGGRITVKVQGDGSSGSSVGDYTAKVENLSKKTTEQTLEEVFGFFGDIEVVSIKINSPANTPFNYAYVNYSSMEDAQRAVDELNGSKIDGSIIRVKVHHSQDVLSPISASPRDTPLSSRQQSQPIIHTLHGRHTAPSLAGGPHGGRGVVPPPLQHINSTPRVLPSRTIKVSIHGCLTEGDLEMIFGQFGTITTQPSIIRGNPDFAYINYSCSDEAQVAALTMNGKQIKGVQVGVKMKLDGRGSGAPMASGSSHDYLQVQCESLIVQVITSPDLSAEYKLQLQGIESSTSTKVTPMKTGNGFNISGNQESLDEAKKHLELVISKVHERLEEESFTLSCHYVPLFTNHELVKQITKIEQKHCIEFLVFDSIAQQSVDVSTFSRFVSAQLKSHTDTPATVDCISKFLSASASTESPSPEGDDIWEWQDDDGTFKAYEPDQSKDFSLKFRQDPTCTFTCLIATKVGVSGYSINFSTMMQTNIKTGKKRQIQRQPVSSTHTSAVWLYTDDKRKLVPYSKQQSCEIENAWTTQSGDKALTLTINGNVYKLDLTQMKQTNVLTLHERKIARRSTSDSMLSFCVHGLKENLKQAVLDLKEELQDGIIKSSVTLPSDSEGTFHSSLCELIKRYFVLASICDDSVHVEGVQGYIDKVVIIVREEKLSFERKLLAQRPSLSTTRSVAPPEHWDIQEEKIALKSVVRGSKEWTEVEKLMHASLPSARIQTLQRIQNQWLWDKYGFSKERMHEQNNGIVNEKQLFHGTSSTPPEKIFKSRQGFDFRFCSKGMWGTGTYFAVNASYSDTNYAYHSARAKQLILAKVLTGETYRCRSDSSLKKPPVKKSHVLSPTSSNTFVDELYDSVCGHTNGSDIFVIYDHEKAYPDYLITYDTTRGYLF